MRAFRVFYDTPGRSGFSEIVLSETEEGVEKALASKVEDYRMESLSSRITRQQEIPLSTVKISELSVAEFLSLTKPDPYRGEA